MTKSLVLEIIKVTDILSVRFNTLPPSTRNRVRHMGFRKGKKKGSDQLPNLTLPPAPMPPLPGMPLPLPIPAVLDSPPLPMPAVLPALGSLPALEEVTETSGGQSETEYNQLWAKKSDKPLPQIYGHIDRISTGEAGSLLDRYADRFGHSLDRDIIVLRKKEHDEKIAQIRDAPVVELVEDESVEQTLEGSLKDIEDQIRILKPDYQDAKSSGDAELLSQLRPQLEALMSERKSIKAQMSKPMKTAKPVIAQESDDSEDIFVDFVAIVDELLGSHLPDEIVNGFVESEDFSVYQLVGADPASADEELRGSFFAIVDGQLANMSQESIDAFVASDDFEIYRTVGEMY